MKNANIFKMFDEIYGLRNDTCYVVAKQSKYIFYKIYDNFYIVFTEELVLKNDLINILNEIEFVLSKDVILNIIIVSDTTEEFKENECFFSNGNNLMVNFLFHNINTDFYMIYKKKLLNPFRKVIKLILCQLKFK